MIVEPAPAKINLALHVRRRRDDGYHDIETLFAFARDGDVVTLEPAESWSFAITGPFAAGLRPHPHPSYSLRERDPSLSQWEREGAPQARKGEGDRQDNLVTRAAAAFRTRFPATRPHAIILDKRLPVASGIGGGSADAAAALRALARVEGVAPDDRRLAAIAAELGADVPACLLGRTALGTGRGDSLTPVEGLAGTRLLLVNPGVGLSTAAVFARWDGVDRGAIPDGSLLERTLRGRNDLEPPARALVPAIGAVLALLEHAPGATAARMSGSGATCFALFDDEAARDAAAAAARAEGWWALATALA